MFEDIILAIKVSLLEVWVGFGNIVVNIIVALLIFFVLYYIAQLAGKLVKKILNWLRLDEISQKLKITSWFDNRGIVFSFAGVIGWIVKWTGVIGAIIVFLRLLNLQTALIYVKALGGFVIKGLSAGIILLFGFFVANFIKELLFGLSKALKLDTTSGKWVSGFIKWGIVVFTIVFTFSEFQISQSVLKTILTAFLAMVALAGGIALGLSGKAWADKMIEKMRKDVEE